jgi:DNA-binding MarR family transcriptional regulator
LSSNRLKELSADQGSRLEAIAEDIFKLHFMFWALRHRNRVEDPYDLTEPEFFTLETLYEKGLCTVGELQQVLDVRPAQMSRIVRSLEGKAKPLIGCSINPQDKRKINVMISEIGKKARDEYKRRRVEANMELLGGMSEAEQEEVWKLLKRYREIMSDMLQHPQAETAGK